MAKKAKFVFWFLALILIMACVPGVAQSPVVPTIDPNAVATLIAQTANAASTQTSAAIPTSSPTATLTPTPRFTDTPEPTATSTVIFIFASPTKIGAATSTSTVGGGSSSSANYACQVVSVSPANGTGYGSRVDFDAVWRVKNIGQKAWDGGSVDYIYLSGDKFHKVATYDLKKSVKVNESIDLIVDMISPKNDGTYTTNWSLRVGQTKFCTLSLTIVVR